MGILAIGWQIGAANAAQSMGLSTTASSATNTKTSTPAATPSATSTPSATASATPSATAAAPAPPAASSDGTWTGASVQTPYGSVQVQVTISAGKITDVTALHLTTAGRQSVQISNEAAPILRQEVLAAQSARVSNVGGATYTTEGYLGSLQSALDQAGF